MRLAPVFVAVAAGAAAVGFALGRSQAPKALKFERTAARSSGSVSACLRRAFTLALVASVAVGCGGKKASAEQGLLSGASWGPCAQTVCVFAAGKPYGTTFIQWTKTNGGFKGTYSEAGVLPSDPTRVEAESGSVTGIVSGSNVTLTFSDGTSASGTLDGSDLTLNSANSDGTIGQNTFHAGSVNDYNQAVAAVHAVAARARAAQAAEQQTQRRQQTVADAANSLASALSTLRGDPGTLDQDSLAGDVSSLQRDVSTVHGDLTTVLADSSDVVCGDAGVASGDEGVLEGDVGVMNGDINTYSSDIASATADIASLHTADRAYEAAASANGYKSTKAPTTAPVGSAISAATSAISQLRAGFAAARAQAVQLLTTAKGYVAQANTACGRAGG